MALPILALVIIELMLRLFGIGGYDPVLKEIDDTPNGKLVITSIAGVRDFFFANPARPGAIGQYAFYSPKAANSVRIVLLGGSMVKGFPQSPRFAMSSFLKEMLSDAWPDRNVEVINLGTTAVASFPVREFLRQALAYQPDLVVIATGHNEFYGAYGVASSSEAGSSPTVLELQYQLNGLGIMQGLTRLTQSLRGKAATSLMEIMVGQNYVAAESWKREAAAALLYDHVGSMIEMSHSKAVPVMVCTLPSNERDLAPIGTGDTGSEEAAIVAAAAASYSSIPDTVISQLTTLLKRHPQNARAHFYLGKAYFVNGGYQQAQQHFIEARDLDPMPWRATTTSQQGIRRAVADQGAQLCEAEAAFRNHSPGGSIGWELMDDHVHPSLPGQALLARSIVETLTRRSDSLQVSKERFASLPGAASYARRLGDNPYDRYAVAHLLRTLYTISFMEKSNPQALQRFNKYALRLESRMPRAIRDIVWQWQKKLSRENTTLPISGMVAHGMLAQKRYPEALALFEVAQHSVASFSSLNLEYVYYGLGVRRQLFGELTARDRELAAQAVFRGRILLRHNDKAAGEIERYITELLQDVQPTAEPGQITATARPLDTG
jgi:tetratricopeptide (TPR) repeat protein